ncbi:MAG TPA: 5-formyltetrahydrofolate cyclo-ligase [Gemmatimonadales bacterium]|nr:5-formyltetrahydrofolate cyclo-ligase [Gemmatimonadales bacterium]
MPDDISDVAAATGASVAAAKATLRRRALAVRDALAETERVARSEAIHARLEALDAWHRAGTLCTYVGIRSEVATLPLLADALATGRRVAVPACEGEVLRLVHLDSLDELTPARFGLLEPAPEVCLLEGRTCAVEAVDLFVVPGVAFDRAGGRLGFGRGYYDRLLAGARPDAVRVGLAFEAQLVERVPTDPYDVPMDLVITEAAVHRRG